MSSAKRTPRYVDAIPPFEIVQRGMSADVIRLRPEPLMELDAWLVPFRRFWSKHVDALEQHLEKMEKIPSVKGKKRHEQP